MSGKEAWFRNSEGNEMSCNVGSVAHRLMSGDGAFVEIDGPGGERIAAEKQFATVGVTYAEADAIAQNDGQDVHAAPVKKPAAKRGK